MVGDGQASDVIWGSSLVSGQSRRVGVVGVGVVMEWPKRPTWTEADSSTL